MSRKHYQRVAEILREVRGEMNGEAHMWLVDQLADMFAQDNPNFDYDRFVKVADPE